MALLGASQYLTMRSFPLLVCVAAVGASMTAQATGVLRGKVLDEFGHPVAHALVYADRMRGATIIERLDMMSDANGTFQFKNLHMGEYQVWAQKLEAGYRATDNDPFNPNALVLCALTSGHTEAQIFVQFAPKAAVVTGWITDAKTGKHLSPHIKVSAAAHPTLSYEHTATGARFKFRVLIPSDTPVILELWADGHKHWFYENSGDTSRARSLTLRPNQILDLDVTVAPDRESEHP